jgi:hypothetical protein
MNPASEATHFYDLFKKSDVTAAAAGWLFESQMDKFLRQGQTVRLYPIHGDDTPRAKKFKNFTYNDYSASDKREDSIVFQLPMSVDYLLEEGVKLQAGRYYRPRSANFPTIDSVFYYNPTGNQPTLLVFQFKRNKEDTGLRRIDNFEIPPNANKYRVVVTLDGIQPDIRVPKDILFPVFHYPVNESAVFPPTSS